MSYVSIKPHGGLGNKMFMIATAYATAEQQLKSWEIIENGMEYHFKNLKPTINYVPGGVIHTERPNSALLFEEIPVVGAGTNILLKGYFQNEKYFKEYRQDILELFRGTDEMYASLQDKYPKLNHSCFLHYRRGDYIGHSLHGVPLELYFKRALFLMRNKFPDTHVYILSNDLPYCKGMELFKGGNCTFIEEGVLESLYVMTLCKHGGICSNSTFSWWGSYLNECPDKLIFFPDKWFLTDEKVDIGMTGSLQLSTTSYEYFDLRSTTFLLPLRIDSEHRFENLKIQLNYLLETFDTKIIILEDGNEMYFPKLHLSERQRDMIQYEFIYSEDSLFHRMKYINMCLSKATTPIVAVLDVDALLPLTSYMEAEALILRQSAEVVIPFKSINGNYNVEPENKESIDRKHIKRMTRSISSGQAGNGYLIFFHKLSYESMGAENENFKAYGPEDDERILRALHFGLRVKRLHDVVFHLNHPRTPNSSNENPYFSQNCSVLKEQMKSFGIERYDKSEIEKTVVKIRK